DSSLLFDERNLALFPKDENGDILYGIEMGGGRIWRPRDVNFQLVFPTETESRTFVASLPSELGERAVASAYAGADGYRWQVRVTAAMMPSHGNVTALEERLR